MYKAKVVGLKGYYKISVKPKKVRFSSVEEKLSFKIGVRTEKWVGRRKSLWFGNKLVESIRLIALLPSIPWRICRPIMCSSK